MTDQENSIRQSWAAKYAWLQCGAECGCGWDVLIDKLLYNIDLHIKQKHISEPYEFQIVQIKEKYGTLRVYSVGPTSEYIRGMIAISESVSAIICEECGSSPARSRGGGWIKTVCDKCAERANIFP